MSQIDELQARIMEALDRIGRSVETHAATGGTDEGGLEAALAEAEARTEAAEAARTEAEARLAAMHEARSEAEARASAAEEARAEAEARLAAAEAARSGGTDETSEDSAEAEGLRQALDEEKLANAQLEERVRVLHARLEALEAERAATEGDHAGTLLRLDSDLQSLRKANAQLRESNAALRAAHEAGVADPHLINKAMMAELEALRAARAVEQGEVALVLAEIDRVVAGSANETEDA